MVLTKDGRGHPGFPALHFEEEEGAGPPSACGECCGFARGAAEGRARTSASTPIPTKDFDWASATELSSEKTKIKLANSKKDPRLIC